MCRIFVVVLALLQLLLPCEAIAQSANALNLDLTSTERTVDASHLFQGQSTSSVVLDLGGTVTQISAGDKLTPSEFVAASQILNGGSQQLLLNSAGNAIGGSFSVNGIGSNISNLVVPSGVTAMHDFGLGQSVLNLTGNLVNSGNIYGYSTNSQVTSAIFQASNIYNQVGGLLSTSLPANLPGITGALSSLNLQLNALNNIVNSGSIISSGSLTASAGSSIINALPAGLSGASPLMQAVNNINLISQSGNLVNSGLITSQLNNINILSGINEHMSINNQAGLLQALNGLVNVRDLTFADKKHLVFWGGDVLASELNLYSGTGIVNLNANNIQALTNIYAGEAHLNVNTDNLQLGIIDLSGDPTFYNTAGNVTINSALNFSGQNLAIVASGNIVTAAGASTIDVSNAAGNGGNITMIAGANFTSSGPASALPPPPGDTTSTLTITGPSSGGGAIDLSTGVAITSLDSRSTGGGGAGGNINLIAFSGINAGSGRVVLPSAVTVQSGGNGAGLNGNINIVAGATSATAISVGGLNSGSATGGGGNITLASAIPSLGGGSVTIFNGALTGSIGSATLQQASINTGAITAPGSIIEINSGLNALTQSIVNNGVGSAGGGTVSITSNSSTVFTINPGAATNGVNGTISANASAGGGGGGSINIFAKGSGGITLTSLANASSAATTGVGGKLTLDAQAGDVHGVLTIGNGALNRSAAGVGNFDGGSVVLKGRTVTVSAGAALNITADATGTGSGGTVNISASGATSDLTIGAAATNIGITARGGSGGSISGTGGTVRLYAGRNLIITPANINASPLGTNGNGATYEFVAGTGALGNLRILAAFNANGVGTGNGGSISLTSNSATAFSFSSAATNGLGGIISARSGLAGGAGGTVDVTNNFRGGITYVTNRVDLTAVSGEGGTFRLISFAGNIAIPTTTISVNAAGGDFKGGTVEFLAGGIDMQGNVSLTAAITINANGSGNGGGGTIRFTGYNVDATPGAGVKTLNANASGTGNGGLIEIKALAYGTSVIVNNVADNFVLNARGGSGGSASGDGGTIRLFAGSNLTITPAFMNASPAGTNGKGATYELTAAGTALSGLSSGAVRILSTGLSANGVGSGDGGSIVISTNNPNTFNIGNSATHGVQGALTANAGTSGSGGTISVTNLGTGGITLGSVANLSANSASVGIGGIITLNAGVGQFVSPSGTINLNASGAGANNGGTFTLVAGAYNITGGALTLNANASGTGNGGTINITASASGADITIGSAIGNFTLSALGGSGGSLAGNGGNVNISSGGNIILNPANLSISPQGNNGNGGILSLNAGTAGFGNVRISAALVLNGVGGGSGGSINLSFSSPVDFIFGSATVNGIASTLSANGSSGGIISINANGGGGIILNDSNLIVANASNGNGGQILLSAPTGMIKFNAGTSLSVNASGSGSGGTILLSAQRIEFCACNAFSFNANAAGVGNGGIVTIAGSNSLQDLRFGTDIGQFSVSAQGGAISGNGGQVSVSAGRDLFVDPLLLASGINGSNGNGAILNLAASRNLLISGGLSANGVGNGNGGTISLSSNSTTIFDLGSATVNGLTSGVLSANAGSSGNGGSISITNNGAGGINLGAAGLVSVNSAGSGIGGNVSLNAGVGNLTITSQVLNANASGNANGGQFVLVANDIVVGGGALTLNANASGNGAGGNVSITSSGGSSDISIGSASGSFIINALGGNTSGDGGVISISSGRNLTVDPTQINAGPQAGNGKGMSISLSAGVVLPGTIFVSSGINASGLGSGQGGLILVNLNNSSSVATFNLGVAAVHGINGNLVANGGASGAGGTISLTIAGSGGIGLSASSNLSVSATSGAGGNISINATGGDLSLASGTYSVNAAVNGVGGQLSIFAGNITSAGALDFLANGAGSGNGGSISLTQTGAGGLTVGAGAGQFTLSATGGSLGSLSGHGGSISITSGGNLVIAPASINASALGYNGNGGNYTFVAGSAGAGNIQISSAFNANGAGFGNGGSVQITVNSASAFNLGSAAVNGIGGILSVNSGITGGNGGSLSVTNLGNGGITLGALANVAMTTTRGNGGSLGLNAGSGTLSLVNGTLNLAGVGGTYNGGAFDLRGNTIAFAGGSLSLNASAAGNGNGGSIVIKATGAAANLTLGTAAGQFILNVRGGSSNSLAGNAGSVDVSAGQNLTVNPVASALLVNVLGSNGNGATVKLSQGTASSGNLTINAGFNVNGVGYGNGGSITINTNSSNTFNLGSAATHGVGGALTATSGNVRGNAGQLIVSNSGVGGITLGAVANVVANATFGNGGELSLTSTSGAINLPNGTLSFNGNVIGNGGRITLYGTAVNVTAGAALALNATGAGVGNGGVIDIRASGAGSSLTVGAASTNFNLNARGGNNIRSLGGSITLYAGGNLTVTPANLLATTQATNGIGPTLDLRAGQNGAGNLSITAALSANATGRGHGGSITLVSNSATAFNLGDSSVNGATGNITANGATTGNGGTISITNNGSGGITFGANTVQANAAGGNGGTLNLTTPGSLTLPSLTISLNGSTGTNNGGNFNIQVSTITTAGTVTFNANATGLGNGGTINIQTTGATGDILVGTGANRFTLNARGGSAGSQAAGGGSINLNSARNLTIATGQLNVSPLSTSGNAGSITLTSGGSGSGNIQITGTLAANATGSGNGGSISINYLAGAGAFTVGSATGNNYVSTQITATAAGNGRGGNIAISNQAAFALTVTNNNLISTNSVSGVAGTLTFNAIGQAVSVAGTSGLVGTVNASGASVNINPQLAGTLITLGSIISTSGNITITNSGAGNVVNMNNASSVNALGGIVSITTRTINLGGVISSNASGNSITIQAPASNSLAVAGSTIFDQTNASAGATRFLAASAGVGISFAANSILLVQGGGLMEFGAPNLTFGNCVLIDALGASTINLNSGGGANNLVLSLPSSSSVTMRTNGGSAINIAPTSGRDLTIQPSAATQATLNLLGAPVNITTTLSGATGNMNINSSVLISTNQAVTLAANNNAVINFNGIISTVASANSVTFTSSSTFSIAGSGIVNQNNAIAGTTRYLATSGAIGFAASANQTVNGGGDILISTPTLTMNSLSALTATGTSNISINSGGGANDLLIRAPSTSSATISTVGGTISIAPTAGRTLTFGLTAAGAGTLNLNGGALSTTTTASTTINANTTLSSDNSILLNVNNSTFSNNGIVRSSATGDSISVLSTGNLTVSGTGVFDQINATAGTTRFIANNGAADINWNGSQTISGAGDVLLRQNTLTFGALSVLSASGASAISIDNGGLSSGLTIQGTNNSSATIASMGGSIDILPVSGQTLTFAKTAGANTATLNFNGSPVLISHDAAVNVNSNVILSLAQAGSFTLNGGASLTNNGMVQSTSTLTFNINGGQLVNNGTIGSAATGNSITVASNTNLTIAGTGIFEQTNGVAGATRFIANNGSADINWNASQTVNGGGAILLRQSNLIFGVAGSISTGGASAISIDNGVVASALTIRTANNSSATISTNNGTIAIASTSGQDIIFAKTAGLNTATLNLNGGAVTISTANAVTAVNLDVILASNNNISLNVDNGTLALNGSLTSSAVAGQINIQSIGALNLAGTPQSPISITGGGAAQILLSAGGANALTLGNGYQYDAGNLGLVVFRAEDAGASVVLGVGMSQGTLGGSALRVSTPNLQLAAGSTLSSSKATGTALTIDTGAQVNDLIIQAPDNGSASISSLGGDIVISPAANRTLTFAKSAGINSTVLNFSGGNLIATTTNAQAVINANVLVQATNNVTVNVNGSTLTINGSLQSSALAGQINIQSTSGLTLAGSPQSALAVTGGGVASVNITASGANNLLFSNNFSFDAGASGTVSFNSTDANGSITLADGITQVVANGGTLNVNTPNLNFGLASAINASGASVINIQPGGLNPMVITVSDGSSGNVSSTNGSINILAAAGNTLSINKSAGPGTANLNLNNAPVVVSASGTLLVGSNLLLTTNNSLAMTASGGAAITNNGTLQASGGALTVTVSGGNLTNNGLITGSSTVTLNINGGGLVNNGIVRSSASGNSIDIASTSSMAISGNGSFEQTNLTPGTTRFIANNGAGDINWSANQAINDGGAILLRQSNLNFGASSALNAGAASTIFIDNGGLATGLTISAPDNSSAAITTTGGSFNIQPTSLQVLTFAKSAGANNATLNFNGAPLAITNDGDIVINANVVVAINNSGTFTLSAGAGFTNNGALTSSSTMTITVASGTIANNNLIDSTGVITLNINGGSLLNNGTLRSAASGDSLNILSTSNMTVGGNGILSQINGSPGSTRFIANNGVGDINWTGAQAINGGGDVLLRQSNLNFGAASTLTTSGASTITIDNGIGIAGLTIRLPDASSALISTSGGALEILPPAGQSISFTKSAGVGVTTLNLLGSSFLAIATDSADISIASSVTLNANSSLDLTMDGGVLTNQGVLQVTGLGNTLFLCNCSSDLVVNGAGVLDAPSIDMSSAAGEVNVSQQQINGSLNILAINGVVVNATNSGLDISGANALNGSLSLTAGGGLLNIQDGITVSATANVSLTGSSVQIGAIAGAGVNINAGDAGVLNPTSTNPSDYEYQEITTPGAIAINSTLGSVTLGDNIALLAVGNYVGLTSADDITSGNNASFFGQAGNVWFQAADKVVLPAGTQIQSVARIDPNLPPVNIGGNDVPAFFGGGIAIWGGSVGANMQAEIFALQDMRSPSGTTVIDPGVNLTGSTLSNTGGSYIEFLAPGAGKIGASNASFSISGGVLSVDPPGDQIEIDGINVSVYGQAYPLPPSPPANNGQDGLNQGIGINLQLSQLFSIQDPTRAAIISTDVTDPMAYVNAKLMAVSTYQVEVVNQQYGWVVIGDSSQPYALSGDDAFLLGEVGSRFIARGQREIEVSEGKVLLLTGKNSFAVNTEFGVIMIPAQSAIKLRVKSSGLVRVTSLSGESVAVTISRNGLTKVVAVSPGKEVLVALHNRDEEDSLALDGVLREVSGQSDKLADLDIQYISFDRSEMKSRETLLDNSFGTATKVGSRLESVRNSLGVNANLPISDNKVKPIAFRSSDSELKSTNTIYMIDAPSALVRRSPRSKIAQLSPSKLAVESGEALIVTKQNITVLCKSMKVEVDSGCIVLCSAEGDLVMVANLYEGKSGAVRLISGDKKIDIMVGQEALIGQKENVGSAIKASNIARRRIKQTDLSKGKSFARSDISMISLLQNHEILSTLVKSDGKIERDLTAKLLKMAACIHHVTSGRGAYALSGN